MSIARKLYELQEIDLEIDAAEKDVRSMTSRLGKNGAVLEARSELDIEKNHLDRLNHRQKTLEWEIQDTSDKISRTEKELYSGRNTNPKELSGLQQEVAVLKNRRSELEDEAVEVMEETESANARVSAASERLGKMEKDWQAEQKQLESDIEERKERLARLKERRAAISSGIDDEALGRYTTLRKQKGTAVAKVEQGICRGCRISLSSAQLQRIKGGSLVGCNSCGRILFLA